MKNINKSTKYIIFGIMTLVLIFGAVAVMPAYAQAFEIGQLIDPFCLFACDDNNDEPSTVNNTYTNSNNVNSNVNSPGATVNSGSTRTDNTNTVRTHTPVVAYNTPVYNYDYSYHQSPQRNNDGPLHVSCYPMPLSARTGDSITWVASAYGGNNAYYYTWTGTDGLSGYGSSVSKTYYSTGYKSATVTVTSGGQTVSKNCDGTANIYADTSYNYNPQPYYYPQTYTYYSPLSVTCNVSNTYANVGNSVTWNAYPSGGNGSYSYSWTGTDGLYGSSQSVYRTYPYAGLKTASVTVYSNGQSMTQYCGSVNVGGYVYGTAYNSYNYNSNINSNNGLDVACYVDPTSARINQPVTWRAEVTGGIAPYTYSWTGSNGVSGSDSSLIKYYDTVGEKNAIVTIRSADGKTATRACTTALTVRGTSTVAPAAPARPVQPVIQPTNDQNNDSLSAATLFSLKNVPWGWVAILVILVLFATVVYLIFNRQKI